MNQKKLASYRMKLHQIRKDLLGDVKKNRANSKEGADQQVADIADDAAQSYTRQLILNLGEQDREELKLVE